MNRARLRNRSGSASYVLPALLVLLLSAAPSFGQSGDSQSGNGHGPAQPSDNVVELTPGAVIPDQYIVVLHDEVTNHGATAQELTRTHGLGLRHVYSHVLKGFAARVPAGRLNALGRDPRVKLIEADQTVQVFAQTTPTGIRRIFAPDNPNLAINGLDDYRIDVDVAVIDTGIASHPDLNLSPNRTDCTSGICIDGTAVDGHGHGTHVAGTIGALDNGIGVIGVAPGARMWGVRVLNDQGRGTMSAVIAGIDWVTAHVDQVKIANMSLGGGDSAALCLAVANSVAAGVTHVVAAGNSNVDAATVSPANCPDAIAVSALADYDGLPGGFAAPACYNDADDTLAGFSNWSKTVKLIAAPGVCILSTYLGGGYAIMSGTSMASPHVAGAASLLAASGTTTPAQIRAALNDNGNFNWTDDSGDRIKEPLLDVHHATVFHPRKIVGAGGGGDTTPPTVSIMAPAKGTASGTAQVRIRASDDGTSAGNLFVTWRVGSGPAHAATYNATSGLYEGFWNTTHVFDGSYSFLAQATNGANNIATTPAVDVTVHNGTPAGATMVRIQGDQAVCGGIGEDKNSRNLRISLTLEDNLGKHVKGGVVSVSISRDAGGLWSGTGRTGANGRVAFTIKRATAGVYTTTLTSITALPLTWDGMPPTSNTCTN